MLPSGDSRRRQQRVPVGHTSGRGTGQSRFHIDAIARSPLHNIKLPDTQALDGQSGRGCLRIFLAKLRIRNFFFVIIGCTSALLIGWVNISANDVIPTSSLEIDQHPVKPKPKTQGTRSMVDADRAPLAKEKNARNLSSKRFSTLEDSTADSSLLNVPTAKQKRSRTDIDIESSEESSPSLQELDSSNLRQVEPESVEENQPESFRDRKVNQRTRTSDILQQQQQQRRRRQLPDNNQQQPLGEWQTSEEANLQQPAIDNEEQSMYSQQQKQGGMYKRRKAQRSFPRNGGAEQLQSEGDEENEGLNSLSLQEDTEDEPQQLVQRKAVSFQGRQAAPLKGRSNRYPSPNDQLEGEEEMEDLRQRQVSLKGRKESLNNPQEEDEEEELQEQQDEESPKLRIRRRQNVSPNDSIEPANPDQALSRRGGILRNDVVSPATPEEFTSSQSLSCPNLDQSHVDRITYWKETRESDFDIVSAYRQAGGREAKYLTFELNATSIQWNSRRRLLETMVALAFATGRTLVLPPKMTLVTTMEEMSKAGMSPWLGFQDLMTLPSTRFQGISVISMDRFLELEGTTGRLKTTPAKNRKGGTPLSPPNGYAHWDGAANMQDLWHYLQSVSYQPEGWNPQTCVLGIPSVVKKSPSPIQDAEEAEDMVIEERVTVDASALVTWMENIWGKHHGRPPPDKLDYQGRPTRVDAPAVERLRELAAERRNVCMYGQELQQAKVLHLQGDQLEGYPFYSFVFFEDWKQDLFVKRLVRDHLRYSADISCAAAKVVDHLEAADANVPAHFHGMHLLLRDLIKGDGQQFEEDDLNVAMSLLVEDLKKWIQPGSRLYIATDMDEQRDCFQILRQTYHLVFISYIESLLEGGLKPVFYPMVEQLVLARAHTFVGSYPSTFSAYVNRLRGYYTTVAKPKSAAGQVDFLQQAAEAQDGTLASYYLAPRQMQRQMRIYQSLRQPLGDLEYPVAWRDIDR